MTAAFFVKTIDAVTINLVLMVAICMVIKVVWYVCNFW